MKIAAIVNTNLKHVTDALDQLNVSHTVYPQKSAAGSKVLVVVGIENALRCTKTASRVLVVDTLAAACGCGVPMLGVRPLAGGVYVKQDLKLDLSAFLADSGKDVVPKPGLPIREFRALKRAADKAALS